MSIDSPLVIILLSMLFSAFFSGMEIAFVSSNKLKIELDKKLGALPAKVYSYFIQRQSNFISAMLLGNNIALVIYGIYMAVVLEQFLGSFIQNEFSIFILQTVLSTLVILITAEFLPKTLFRINPNQTLRIFTVPVAIIYFLLYPLVSITMFLSEWIMNSVFKVKFDDDKLVFGKIDLDNYLKEATSNIENSEELENEVQILQNALDFSNVKARECMVPRNEIIALEEGCSVKELNQNFIDSGYSRILIYRETTDNIIGYTHLFDLFKSPKSIKSILMPIQAVPETMPANDIMENLIKANKSIAVIIDEYGGTSGIITIEDIVEELFGNIEDEHDTEQFVEKQISNNEFIFSARLEIDELNKKYNLEIPESEDYNTLAGFVLQSTENLPQAGEIVLIHQYKIRVLKVDDNKIDLIRVLKLESE